MNIENTINGGVCRMSHNVCKIFQTLIKFIFIIVVSYSTVPYFLAYYPHGVLPAQAQKYKFFEKNRCITRTDR